MIAPAGHDLTTLGNVIRGQAAQISELQAALLEARQQLAEQELGAAHEPSCLTIDVTNLRPGEFVDVTPKSGQSISVVGGTVIGSTALDSALFVEF